MARHFPSNRNIRRQKQPWKKKQKQKQEEQEQPKPKGWYCKKHDTKYFCIICGDDNIYGKPKESKYHFLDSVDPITF